MSSAREEEEKKEREQKDLLPSIPWPPQSEEEEEKGADAHIKTVIQGKFLVEEVPAPEVVMPGLPVVSQEMGERQVEELDELERPIGGLGGPLGPAQEFDRREELGG